MEHNRKEPQEYLYKTIEVKKGGATGTGSLKSRLLRLMEQDLERQGNQTEKYTLLYGRLSNEDKREGTSLSIQHQEEMLRDYAAKQGFCNPLFLYDDGVSGTKTNRPGFQRVLAMIREGQAATLIVTDLTRLYRNQSEANNLLEIVFPALGVRFIAITNNYDSATNTESDEDLAMFSNLFNEWYPRQTSRKINAVIQHKAEKGVRIASIPPYGYQKDPAERFKIIPDPEAAEQVRYISRLCASGMVQCADCGSTHYLCRCGSWDESQYSYLCGRYHRHKETCTPHTVKALYLRETVLKAIQDACAAVQKDREAFISHLTAKKSGQLKKELAAKRKELEQAKNRQTELDNLIAATFEKLATGILTDGQFKQLNGRYLAEQEALKGHISRLETELAVQQDKLDSVGNFLAIVDRHLEVPELTPEILREFVHHITVHERDGAYRKKFYTQKIDIHFNYIGTIQ